MRNRMTFVLAALVATTLGAAAQDTGTTAMPGHGDMPMGDMQMGAADASPASKAFAAANMRMHEAMKVSPSGDTDVDFVRGMIPHHQGAIDMAKIELQYGKDPAMRKMAQEIIKAQESEVSTLEAWLAKKGK